MFQWSPCITYIFSQSWRKFDPRKVEILRTFLSQQRNEIFQFRRLRYFLLDSVPNQFFKGSRARGKREKICATFARGDRLHARLFNASNTFMREYRLAARGPRLFKRVNRPLGARVAVGARRGEKIKKKKEEKKKLDFRARTRRRLTGQYRERFPAIYFHRQLQNIFAIYATSGSVIYRDIYIYTVARYERNDGATSMKYF